MEPTRRLFIIGRFDVLSALHVEAEQLGQTIEEPVLPYSVAGDGGRLIPFYVISGIGALFPLTRQPHCDCKDRYVARNRQPKRAVDAERTENEVGNREYAEGRAVCVCGIQSACAAAYLARLFYKIFCKYGKRSAHQQRRRQHNDR